MKRISYVILCVGMVLPCPGFAGDGAGVVPAATANAEVLNQARALISGGKAGAAYALLSPLAFDRAGEPEFDDLLGIAALESGHADLATLAFERVLAVDPENVAARTEMARAYFQTGDMLRARNEFGVALRQNADPASRAVIQRYLQRIEAGEHPTRVTAYVQGGVGRSSNANNATSQADIAVPFAGNAVAALSPANVKSAANDYDAAAGADVVHDVGDDRGVYAGAALSQRGYNRLGNFDTRYVNGHAGLLFGREDSRFRIGLNVGRYDLGRVRNRDDAGLEAGWHRMLDAASRLDVYAQTMRYRYAEPAMQLNDFDRQLVGLAWRHAYGPGGAAVSVGLYHGREGEASARVNPLTQGTGRTDGARLFNGVRLSGQMACADDLVLTLGGGQIYGRYGRTNPSFLVQRNDRLYDATLAADWHFAPLWTLTPQLGYLYNSSNIVVYRFNRFDAGLVLRRDFK